MASSQGQSRKDGGGRGGGTGRSGGHYYLRQRGGEDPNVPAETPTSSKASAGPGKSRGDRSVGQKSPSSSPVSSPASHGWQPQGHRQVSQPNQPGGRPPSGPRVTDVTEDGFVNVEVEDLYPKQKSHEKGIVLTVNDGARVEDQLSDAIGHVDTGLGHSSQDTLSENRELQQLLSDTRMRLHRKEEKLSELRAYVEKLKQQGAHVHVTEGEQSMVLRLQQDNAQKTQDLEDVHSQLSVKDRQLRLLQQKLRGSRDLDAQEQESFSAYQRHLQDLSKELEDGERRCKKQDQEINQLRRRLDHAEALEGQVTTYAMDVSRLEEEKRALEKQLEDGKHRDPSHPPVTSSPGLPHNRLLQEEVARLRQVEQESSRLERSVQYYKQMYERAAEESKKLLVEVSSLTVEVQALQRAGDFQRREPGKDLEYEVKRLTMQKDRRIAALQKELDEARAAINDQARLLKHSKEQSKKVMQLKQERMALEEGVKEGQQFGQSLQQSLQTIEEENRWLHDQLQSARKDKEYVEEALKTAVAERERLEGVGRLQVMAEGDTAKSAGGQTFEALQQKYERMKEENRKLVVQFEKMGKLSEDNSDLLQKLNSQTAAFHMVVKEKEELEGLLQAARAESLVYKEDFEGERSDRAKAHGMMDEIRSKHQEEKVKMEDQIRRLQKELHTAQEEVDTHKYSRELAEKTHQRKEHEMTAALAVTEKAKEETKTKALQVTQYKKQVDQLQDQLSQLKGQNERLVQTLTDVRKKMEKTSSENAKLTKELSKKKKKTSTSDDTHSMSAESRLARMENLYEEERSTSDVLRTELDELRKDRKKIFEENANLKELLEQQLTQQESRPEMERPGGPSKLMVRSCRQGQTPTPTASPVASPLETYSSRDLGGSPQLVEDHRLDEFVNNAVVASHHNALHAQQRPVAEQERGSMQHQHRYAQHPQSIPPTNNQSSSAYLAQAHPQAQPDHLPIYSPTEAGTHAYTDRGLGAPRHKVNSETKAVGCGDSSSVRSANSGPMKVLNRGIQLVGQGGQQRPLSDVQPAIEHKYSDSNSRDTPLHTYQRQGSHGHHSGDTARADMYQQHIMPGITPEVPILEQRREVPKAVAEEFAAQQRVSEPSSVPGAGNLDYRLDTTIHDVAGNFAGTTNMDREGRARHTRQHIPYDPNLTCPLCNKQFRLGDIQVYRRHVATCGGTAEEVTEV